jgi:FolB domain-containing protein
MDSLLLQNISVWTRIGVSKEERSKPQQLLVSVELFHPLASTAKADDPAKGIDYDRVLKLVQRLAETERKTIERFAEDVAADVLKEIAPERGVKVTVQKKPYANADAATVTIHRPYN